MTPRLDPRRIDQMLAANRGRPLKRMTLHELADLAHQMQTEAHAICQPAEDQRRLLRSLGVITRALR